MYNFPCSSDAAKEQSLILREKASAERLAKLVYGITFSKMVAELAEVKLIRHSSDDVDSSFFITFRFLML